MTDPIDITAVAHGGFGIGRINGQVCFVAYGVPGDLVRVRITRHAKGVLWAEIEEILRPSPDREAPICPQFGRCGGCTWLHFAYPAQAHWKQRIAQDCLERIAKLQTQPTWIEDPALRLGYRTRAEFHGDGRHWGFFALGTEQVADIEQCPLCHPGVNAALHRLRQTQFRGSVEVVVNPDGPEVLLWTKEPSPKLRALFPLAGSTRDRRRASFLFDGTPIVNGAFSQSSLLLNRLLVRCVQEMAGPVRKVLDLYCGTGNLSLGLADSAHVLGLDHNRAAVAAVATLGRGEYHVGGEAEFGRALSAEAWDAVILDPPRTGARGIVEAMAQSRAQTIVYVSCDPATLARDVKGLVERGWSLTDTRVLDLFPHTAHIETVCRLVR